MTINNWRFSVLPAILLGIVVSACGAETSETAVAESQDQDEFKQWQLPEALREISGLALTADERLLAVTDEKAIVYELDYVQGKIVKAFAVGDPVLRGDFEGIAVLGDTVWLMTSHGILLAAKEGPDGGSVRYRRFDTRSGDFCEFEGLGQDREAGTLVLACKEGKKRKKKDLMIFEWSASADGIELIRDVPIPGPAIRSKIDEKRISPSGIAIDPQTGEMVLVAAREDALVRLTPDGALLEAIILENKSRHKQAEGIEITRDGRLLIADEGGKGRARLAVYAAPSPASKNNE